eukprot:SAG22_NODE_134_length_18372_cov_33.054944_4_plen_134_part_00
MSCPLTGPDLASRGNDALPGLPVSLAVDTKDEPDTREGSPPAMLHGRVTVGNLTAGKTYELYRYHGTAALPIDGSKTCPKVACTKVAFTATAATHVHNDPRPIISSTAVYYRAFAAAGEGSTANEQDDGKYIL